MDRDLSPQAIPHAAAGSPAASGRYDFEVPEHLSISDMLAIQLADCVRIVRRLSDEASDPQVRDLERVHTIHSLESVVNASEKLTRTLGRLRNDAWDDADETSRKKGRKV